MIMECVCNWNCTVIIILIWNCICDWNCTVIVIGIVFVIGNVFVIGIVLLEMKLYYGVCWSVYLLFVSEFSVSCLLLI